MLISARHNPAHSPTLWPATVFGLGVPEITSFGAGVLPTHTRLPPIVLPATAGLGVPAKLAVGVFDVTSTLPVRLLKIIVRNPAVVLLTVVWPPMELDSINTQLPPVPVRTTFPSTVAPKRSTPAASVAWTLPTMVGNVAEAVSDAPAATVTLPSTVTPPATVQAGFGGTLTLI